MKEESPTIDFTVVSAKDLKVCDIGHTSDPYVQLIFGPNDVHKSEAVHKTLNPVWNFGLQNIGWTYEDPTKLKIQIIVWDKHKIKKDQYMGETVFQLPPLSELHHKKVIEQDLPLEAKGEHEEAKHISGSVKVQAIIHYAAEILDGKKWKFKGVPDLFKRSHASAADVIASSRNPPPKEWTGTLVTKNEKGIVRFHFTNFEREGIAGEPFELIPYFDEYHSICYKCEPKTPVSGHTYYIIYLSEEKGKFSIYIKEEKEIDIKYDTPSVFDDVYGTLELTPYE